MEPVIVMLDEVDSTNRYACEHFAELPDGALVATRNQTAGRGRRGRSWVSPPGANIAVTAVLKNLHDGFHAGCLIGLAGLECVRAAAPELDPFLKWPNDLYLENRKLAGILSESARIVEGRVCGVATGIGLNVNLSENELAGVGQPAISLRVAAKRKFNLDFLIKKLAESLLRYYIIYLKSAETVFAEWKRENRLLGERLTVIDARGVEQEGVFKDILPDGRMVLESVEGAIVFSCGDVRIDRDSIDWGRFHRNGRRISINNTITTNDKTKGKV